MKRALPESEPTRAKRARTDSVAVVGPALVPDMWREVARAGGEWVAYLLLLTSKETQEAVLALPKPLRTLEASSWYYLGGHRALDPSLITSNSKAKWPVMFKIGKAFTDLRTTVKITLDRLLEGAARFGHMANLTLLIPKARLHARMVHGEALVGGQTSVLDWLSARDPSYVPKHSFPWGRALRAQGKRALDLSVKYATCLCTQQSIPAMVTAIVSTGDVGLASHALTLGLWPQAPFSIGNIVNDIGTDDARALSWFDWFHANSWSVREIITQYVIINGWRDPRALMLGLESRAWYGLSPEPLIGGAFRRATLTFGKWLIEHFPTNPIPGAFLYELMQQEGDAVGPALLQYTEQGRVPDKVLFYGHLTSLELIDALLARGWRLSDDFLKHAIRIGDRQMITAMRERGHGWARASLADALWQNGIARDFVEWLLVEARCPLHLGE
jgi:hypothetical protein